MPNRPPQNKPKTTLYPLVFPDGETSPELQKYITNYVDYLNTTGKAEIDRPDTPEKCALVHPVAKFRAYCHHCFGKAEMADVILHTLGDCGLAVMGVEYKETSKIIVKP